MATDSITTLIKMMESLPENAQDQVVEHLRDYLEDMKDEIEWDAIFKKTQPQLISAPLDEHGRKSLMDLPIPWIMRSYEIVHIAILLDCLQFTSR